MKHGLATSQMLATYESLDAMLTLTYLKMKEESWIPRLKEVSSWDMVMV